MARFTFKLDPVLEQRKREEQRHRAEVAGLQRERLDLETEIAACYRQIDDEKHALRDLLAARRIDGGGGEGSGGGEPGGRGVDLGQARWQAGASLRLVGRTQQLAVKLAGVHQRLDRAQLGLLEATIKRQAIETLREQAEKQWKAELDRREANELDELVTAMAVRARSGDGGLAGGGGAGEDTAAASAARADDESGAAA